MVSDAMPTRWGLGAALLLSFLAMACATTELDGVKLPPQKVDIWYRTLVSVHHGTFEGAKTAYYIKRFSEGGFLAFCGYRPAESGTLELLQREWLDNAVILVNGQPVIKAGFIEPRRIKSAVHDFMAPCVRTKTKATEDIMRGRIGVRGGKIRIVF